MAGLGDLLGPGSAGRQLFVWAVLGGLVGALADPVFTEVQQSANHTAPVKVLPPELLANMVVRHVKSHDDAAGQAQYSGISGDKFTDLVHAAGRGPAPGDLATALRRKIIGEKGTGPDSTSFEQGIAESDLKDKWVDVVKALAVQWPSPTDALEALLEGQISEAEAHKLYEQFGGDPQFFTMLFNTRGSAPTPVQAADMANRKLIPWKGTGPNATSFEQAFLEGPWRNKWLGAFEAAAEYLPPPRTVTAMVRAGSLTDARASELLAKQGLASDLVAAYIEDAHRSATATQKDITMASVLGMYETGLIKDTEARAMLTAGGYSTKNADLLLAYADLRKAITQVSYAVDRIRALYVARKIDRATAVGSLNTLNVPADQVAEMVRTWDVAAAVNVKTLTEAQIVTAWFYQLLDQPAAQRELQAIGYTPHDAWVLLSIKNKAPLPDEPPDVPAPV